MKGCSGLESDIGISSKSGTGNKVKTSRRALRKCLRYVCYIPLKLLLKILRREREILPMRCSTKEGIKKERLHIAGEGEREEKKNREVIY